MKYQKKLLFMSVSTTNVDFPMWYRITRGLRKKRIKNSQSLYNVLVRVRQNLKNT